MMLTDRSTITAEFTDAQSGLGADTAAVLVTVLAIALACVLAAYVVLAVLVYQGRNWARIAAMAFSVSSIIVYAISFFNGESVTLRRDIFGLPVDILALLALSAQSSSLWARRITGSRQNKEGLRHQE